MTDNPEFLEKSMCNSCKYKVERVVVLLDTGDWNIEVFDDDALNEAIENGDPIQFKHFLCSKLSLDLDHIVVECSCFKPKRSHRTNNGLIKNERVLDLIDDDLSKETK